MKIEDFNFAKGFLRFIICFLLFNIGRISIIFIWIFIISFTCNTKMFFSHCFWDFLRWLL